jgi:5-methylcytosine-specific restriction endonuclease McrA
MYCGRRAPEDRLHIDHIVPWSKGGTTVFDNLRTACDVCNLGKGASYYNHRTPWAETAERRYMPIKTEERNNLGKTYFIFVVLTLVGL